MRCRSAGRTVAVIASWPSRGSCWRSSGTHSAGLADSTPKIVAQFGISPAEADAWLTDLKSRTGDGDYFFSLNRYMFVARPTPRR